MFIRESKTVNKKTNTIYVTHKLVENYRTEKGTRQRVIMSLGTLTLPKIRWRELASLLESRIIGQETYLEDKKELSELADGLISHNEFVKKEKETNISKLSNDNKDIEQIDMDSIATCENRSLGAELVANEFWNRLEFDNTLKTVGFSDKQIAIAKVLVLGKLIYPTSELGTFNWFKDRTSLSEMTDINISKIGKDLLYEVGDLLFENKESIEKRTFDIECKLFSISSKIFLYDLTNTYIEGSAKNNNKAAYGHSKEKRYDCPLVTLALVVNTNGFPVFSQIYKGNKSEPESLKDVLENLKKDTAKYELEKPILIMDRGIATKDNLDLIREYGYLYTLITRSPKEKQYTKEFEEMKRKISKEEDYEQEGWHKLENGVYVKKVIKGETAEVLAISIGKMKKERSLNSQQEERFLEATNKIKSSIQKGNICVPIKISERIGRLKEKYPTASQFYEISIQLSEDQKKATDLNVIKKPKKAEKYTLTGCYVIETTQNNLTAKEIWEQYMQQTRIENAFKDLKSQLGMRPIFHQKGERTEAHLFISVLAYHILNAIEVSLKANGDSRLWKTIKEVLSTHIRCTVILTNTDSHTFHVRISSRPEPVHNQIYRSLGIKDFLKSKKYTVK